MKDVKELVPFAKVVFGLWLFVGAFEYIAKCGGDPIGAVVVLVGIGVWTGWSLGKSAGKEG